ncbi:hypothetical protein [Geobacter sp.]|uniref:hypothetical protein n=1 Tax=Geobacter sp. TaxID=46610 RepID=UPI0027BAD8F2|nr:hypothetical protein [Geobacter sp.]
MKTLKTLLHTAKEALKESFSATTDFLHDYHNEADYRQGINQIIGPVLLVLAVLIVLLILGLIWK